MTTVVIENNEIRLNSQLDELAFGKMNYSSIITETGLIARGKKITDKNYQFTFEPWSFNDVKSFSVPGKENNYVFYCGNSEGFSNNAKTLLQYFEKAGTETASVEDKDNMFNAAFIVCSALTQAAKEKVALPINGADGIIVDLTEDTTLLFLPGNLFKYSANGLPELDFANLHSCWINQTLTDLPALCFERAVIAYKMLTGRFPYPSSNEVERNADILDRKFLPIELCINGLNKELALEINKALQLNVNVVNIPGKKQKGKANEDLTPTADFPLELLKDANKNLSEEKMSDEEFEAKAAEYLKSQNSKVETKRKLRRNKSRIFTIIVAAIVVLIASINGYKTRQDEYTSRGLSSTDTIQAYFIAMNTKDSSLVANVTKGRAVHGYSDAISQMFVISKQRQQYTADLGFVCPQRWFFYVFNAESDPKAGLYGASNVTIDGNPVAIKVDLQKKNQKPVPVKEENGVALKNGSVIQHKVEFYLFHSEGTDTDENGIVVEKNEATFTLTYSNKQWMITNIETEDYQVDFDSFEFKKEYFSLMKASGNDFFDSANKLKFRYDFVPTEQELRAELDRISKEQADMEQEFAWMYEQK